MANRIALLYFGDIWLLVLLIKITRKKLMQFHKITILSTFLLHDKNFDKAICSQFGTIIPLANKYDGFRRTINNV